MDIVGILIGIIVALGGAFFYVNTKRKSAEALNENLETKEKILDSNKIVAEKQAQLDAEAIKRKELEDKLKEDIKNVDLDALKDFFNSPPKP